jgi:hypothetical protein
MIPDMPGAKQGLPPEKLQILQDVEVAFAGDKELMADYLHRFGWTTVTAANVRIVKQAKGAVTQNLAAVEAGKVRAEKEKEDAELGKDPYYAVDLKCPACDTAFIGSSLRAKSLILEYNYKSMHFPLMVPESKKPMKKYRLADPLIRSAMVCPGCLFSSATQSLYLVATTSTAVASKGLIEQLAPKKLVHLKELVAAEGPRRGAVAGSLAGGDAKAWNETTQKEVAAVGFFLAGMCGDLVAQIEHRIHFTAGEAYLSSAKLYFDLDRPADEMRCLQKARDSFNKAFETGGKSATPIYLLAAVCFHIGDLAESRVWAGRLLTQKRILDGAANFIRQTETLAEDIKKQFGGD